MPVVLVSSICLIAMIGAFVLAEWGASHWVRTRRQREQAFHDERADWPPEP